MSGGSGPRNLDTSHADRKVWLLKVPGIVAGQWREACQASLSGQTAPLQLGVVRSAPNTSQASGSLELSLTGVGQPNGVPSQYRLRAQPADTANMIVFQEHQGDISVEGCVVQKADVLPVGGPADPQYRLLNRERNEKAATKTRTLRMIEDPRTLLRRAPAPISVSLSSKRKAGGDGRDKEKRARVAKDVLEQQLFRLFEKQAHYTFAQLQVETEQPAVWLKEVLLGVASLNKRGPLSGQWELKREYRLGGAGAAAAPAPA